MADEPRRSGRATKGQHNKDRDVDEEGSKKKTKGKGSKNKEAEDEENEIIRCVCGQYEEEEDTQRDMICCDKCAAWQHNDCMLLPYPPDKAPDKYFCEQCKPGDHKALLEAMSRGERPWEEVTRQREAAAVGKGKKKKGGKRGRKSGSRPSEGGTDETPDIAASNSPAPDLGDGSVGQKRKHEDPIPPIVTQDLKKPRQSPGQASPSVGNARNGSHTASQKRKSVALQAPSRQGSGSGSGSPQTAVASSVDELSALRKKSAGLLIKILSGVANDAHGQGKGTLLPGASAEEVGTRLGLNLEHALYDAQSHGSGDPNEAYRTQLRAIIFNVKKNDDLRDGVLKGTITAYDLATMSPTDMASQEQQLRDAEIKKEQEKQHTIIQEDAPRIRRTHKGDEYINEAEQVVAEPEESSHRPVRRRESNLGHAAGEVKSPIAQSPDGLQSPTGKPLAVDTRARPRPSTDPERKSSQTFNIQSVWSSVQGSPDGDRPTFPQIPYQPSATTQKTEPAEADPDIDALLKDEDVESPPYSPKSYEEDSSIVWRGTINMTPVARFQCYAKQAAGAEVEHIGLTWQQLIPSVLTIEGRIDPGKADSYLCGLQYSSSSDVVVVSFRPADTPHDRHQFGILFNYFKTRNRYGVGINPSNPAIKDIYLIPLEAGSTSKPELLSLLENDSVEIPATDDILIVPFVIRKNELNPPPTPKDAPLISASPIVGYPPTQPPQLQSQPAYPIQAPQTPTQPQPQPYATTLAYANAPVPSPSPAPAAGQTQTQPQAQPTNLHQPSTTIPHQPTGQEAAHLILGAQASQLPAVQSLLQQAPNVGIPEMYVVRECLAQKPAAGQDIKVLEGMLLDRQRGAGGAGTG